MRTFLLGLLLSALGFGAINPNRVLVIVNDAMPAETGTGGVGASLYVAQQYIAARGIPSANIFHVTTNTSQVMVYTSEYLPNIETPLTAYLDASGGLMRKQILYIVTTYGVPLRVLGLTETVAVDSLIAGMYAPVKTNTGTLQGLTVNPYFIPVPAAANQLAYVSWVPIPNTVYWTAPTAPLRFQEWADQRENAALWKMFAVSRLDGPSALLAKGLVDKAIAAEVTLRPSSGTAYWDWRGTINASDSDYLPTDTWTRDGGVTSFNKGFTTYLHRQTVENFPDDVLPSWSAVTVHIGGTLAATNSLFGWGWIFQALQGMYAWVPGAIGGHMISCTGVNIRTPNTVDDPAGTSDRWGCNWVPRMIEDGITATWGTTDEPFPRYHAQGLDVFNYFTSGYNFADSFTLSQPILRWTVFAVGDPLYQPKGLTPPTGASVRGARMRGGSAR